MNPVRYFIIIGGSVLVTAILSWCFFYYYDARLQFYHHAFQEKKGHLETFDKEQTHFLFLGGSSCSFSIDAVYLQKKHKLQVANMGLAYSFGLAPLLEIALQETKQNTIVVLALEYDWYSKKNIFTPTRYGSKLWYRTLREHYGEPQLVQLLPNAFYHRSATRADSLSLLGYLLKLITNRSPFRYSLDEIKKGGVVITKQRGGFPHHTLMTHQLSANTKQVLKRFVKLVKQRGGEVVFLLPWLHVTKEIAAQQRANNQQLEQALATIAPVIYEQEAGCSTKSKYYADTSWHLNAMGIRLRSDKIAVKLKQLLTKLKNKN